MFRRKSWADLMRFSVLAWSVVAGKGAAEAEATAGENCGAIGPAFDVALIEVGLELEARGRVSFSFFPKALILLLRPPKREL
jgi:hypothetical protein